jgi:hypothetical protein
MIPKEEWSGILLFRPVGSIKNPGEFKIILEDIIPMDKGSSAYTEYENMGELMQYFDECDPQVEKDYQDGKLSIGHIHSHNVMRVFFSGTDMEELEDNCVNHFYYLSLIVNNFMDFTAKIAIHSKVELDKVTVPWLAKDEQGQPYELDTVELTYKKDRMYVYDCNIIVEQEALLVPETFRKKVTEVCEKAEKKTFAVGDELDWYKKMGYEKAVFPKKSGYNNKSKSKPGQKRIFEDDKDLPPVGNTDFSRKDPRFTAGSLLSSFNRDMEREVEKKKDLTDIEETAKEFILFLLRGGEEELYDNLYYATSALEDRLDIISPAAFVLQKYTECYDTFMTMNRAPFKDDMNFFIEFLEAVISDMEYNMDTYPMLLDIVDGLEKFREKLLTQQKLREGIL